MEPESFLRTSAYLCWNYKFANWIYHCIEFMPEVHIWFHVLKILLMQLTMLMIKGENYKVSRDAVSTFNKIQYSIMIKFLKFRTFLIYYFCSPTFSVFVLIAWRFFFSFQLIFFMVWNICTLLLLCSMHSRQWITVTLLNKFTFPANNTKTFKKLWNIFLSFKNTDFILMKF